MSSLLSSVHSLSGGWYYLLIGVCAAAGTYRVLSHVYEHSQHDIHNLKRFVARARREEQEGSGSSRHTTGEEKDDLSLVNVLEMLSNDIGFSNAGGGKGKRKGGGPGEWSTTEDLVVQSMGSLASIALYSDYKLRTASSELLYDFAMRPSTLRLILRTAGDTREIKQEERLRALVVLMSLAQSQARVRRLVRAGVMRILVDGMRDTDNKEVCIHAGAILSALISHPDDKDAQRCRSKAKAHGILEVAYETLMLTDSAFEESGGRTRLAALHSAGCTKRIDATIVAICSEIAKTYTMDIEAHDRMIRMGFLRALLSAIRQSPTNLEMVRAAMEAMVRLCTYISILTIIEFGPDPTTYMSELMDHGAVDVIASCIRHTETDVASWGIIILHEFTMRNVGRRRFAETAGLARWLCWRISTDNQDLNQRIFRTLWHLCAANHSFAADVAQPANLRRILGAIKMSDDKDLKLWCITLANRLSTQPSSHLSIVESPFLHAFPALIADDDSNFSARVLPEMAQLVSRLCNSITLAPMLHDYPIVSTVLRLLLRTNSSGAKLAIVVGIIRATSRSRSFLTLFIDDDTISRIMHLVGDFGNDVTQNYSAKCLVALLYGNMVSKTTVFYSVMVPYLSSLNRIYRITIGAFFCDGFAEETQDEDASAFEHLVEPWPPVLPAEVSTSLSSLDNQLESARVLFSTMQLHFAECKAADAHFLSDAKADIAVHGFLDFQMILLAQMSMHLMRYFDMWDKAEALAEGNSWLSASSGREYLDRNDVISAFRRTIRSPRGRRECARAGVNTFVMVYYLDSFCLEDAQNDPHFCAAAEDNRMLLARNYVIMMRGATGVIDRMDGVTEQLNQQNRPWAATGDRQRKIHAQPTSQESGIEDSKPQFTGVLHETRMRCLLPFLYLVLDAFADSLSPGLMIQSPAVTRRALWLMRIFYNEFPDLRGLTMRVLASIDLSTLCRADAAGLVDLCSSYMVEMAVSSSGLLLPVDCEDTGAGMDGAIDVAARIPNLHIDDENGVEGGNDNGDGDSSPSVAEQQKEPTRVVDEDPAAEYKGLREWLEPMAQTGISTLATLSAEAYFEKHEALRPESIATAGRFYAQFALDRYSAGWQTCEDLYSRIEPQSVSDQGAAGCWIIDRAGPRGAGQVNGISTAMRGAGSGSRQNTATNDGGDSNSIINSGLPLISRTSSRNRQRSLSSASSSASGGAPHSARGASSSSLAASPLLSSSPSSISLASPFLATIVSDPSVDADGAVSAAVSGPQTALMDPPGIVYHSYAPYYPTFTALADGCTVWNAGWKFESVRMRTGVDGRLGGVHRFHARLLSAGLVQVGWCTDQCGFFPESGVGVGDDFESVAYDGYRQRKWFGMPDKSTYGEEWKAGDVVSAELDLDNGRVVFYQNGRSLGLAFGINEHGFVEGSDSGFQGLSRDRTWYPAFSLSYNQGVVFLGGDTVDHQSCTSIRGSGKESASANAGEGGTVAHLKSALAEKHAVLRSLGVAKAFRIRFEFQDLDTFPCISFPLPGDMGQIIVGPVTDMGNLSTYLQPQWWALWIQPPLQTEDAPHPPVDVRTAAASDLARLFSQAVRPDGIDPMSMCWRVRRAHMLTSAMRAASWIYFIVGASGKVCLATEGDTRSIVFDAVASGSDSHVWLPVVSPAVVSFELVPLYV
ncbi:hypothetical protein EV177_003717 [Coemansia sp. RSA 1804]|nr:hypothetical protein EV177_003717 [Coemansia sp. RSA 1804]